MMTGGGKFNDDDRELYQRRASLQGMMTVLFGYGYLSLLTVVILTYGLPKLWGFYHVAVVAAAAAVAAVAVASASAFAVLGSRRSSYMRHAIVNIGSTTVAKTITTILAARRIIHSDNNERRAG